MSLTWSGWRNIINPSNYNKCAIYRIRLCERGNPVHIHRFLGIDDCGILSIGRTTNLEQRRKQFINALKGIFGHSEGNLLNILEQVSPLLSLYPDRDYEYSFVEVSTTNMNDIEEEQIKAYVKIFGEVPPLNSAIPNRYEAWI